jgi:hypothetical protein
MGAGRAAERGDTTGYQGQGRGSGVTSNRPDPGGGNTGGGPDRDRQVDRDRQGGPSKADIGGGIKDLPNASGSGDYMSKVPYTKSDVNAIADQLSKAYGIDPRLVKAQLMNESGMNPFPKTGSAGEIGPGQIKPSTFKDPGYGVTPGTGDITNPYTNIDFQIRYLIGRGAKGDVTNLNTDEGIREALEAYNSGSNKSKYASDIMGSMGREIGPLRRATDVVLGAGRSAVDTIMNAPKKTYETLTSAMDSLTNPVSGQQEFNRDRQMTQEEVNIAQFNRLHPEAGSNRELYGGRDQAPLSAQGASATTPPAVVPPVVPTEPVMPTVPTFATAQRYTGTPTVATPGFNFSTPFAPRPSMDFANLGQAYAPTALPSASPQPLPGIPGAAYATPYQRLG